MSNSYRLFTDFSPVFADLSLDFLGMIPYFPRDVRYRFLPVFRTFLGDSVGILVIAEFCYMTTCSMNRLRA